MTNSLPNHSSSKESGARYILFTRYDIEGDTDPEGSETSGTVKNFPKTFIPMKELEDIGD